MLVPLYRRDYATAKTRALAVAESSPWVFESKKLAADAVYAAAVVDIDRGRYDEARPQLDEASALYAQAADSARSDASVYEAAAQAKQQRAEIDTRQGKPPKQALDDALALIDHAITAEFRCRDRVHDEGVHPAGEDPSPRVDRRTCVRSSSRPLQPPSMRRGSTRTTPARGTRSATRTSWRHERGLLRGGRGETWWSKACDEFKRGLAIRPNDPWTNNDLGLAHRWLGEERADTGGDPMPEYDAALAGYRRATTIDSAYVFGWSNQAELSGRDRRLPARARR